MQGPIFQEGKILSSELVAFREPLDSLLKNRIEYVGGLLVLHARQIIFNQGSVSA